MDAPAGLVSLGSRHDAKSNLAGSQGFDTLISFELLALGWENGGYADQVLLLDIGIAQGKFKRGQSLSVDTYTTGKKVGRWNWKHLAPVWNRHTAAVGVKERYRSRILLDLGNSVPRYKFPVQDRRKLRAWENVSR